MGRVRVTVSAVGLLVVATAFTGAPPRAMASAGPAAPQSYDVWASASAGTSAVSGGLGTPTCGIRQAHPPSCWGDNQLGVGNRTRGHPPRTTIGSPDEPPRTKYFLAGVDATGPDDAWAGGHTMTLGQSTTLAMHWDGVEWTEIPTPSVAGASRLDSVNMISPTDGWAVGIFDFTHGSDSIYYGQTLIEHWDGTTWTRIASGDPSGILRKELKSVVAISSDDVWAAGYRSYDDEEGAISLTEHWDGITWSWVPSGLDGGGSRRLFGVSGSSSSDVWAVGNAGGGGFTQHWDGSAFARANPPGQRLLAVAAVTPTDAWGVGRSGAVHWDGARWRSVQSPSIGALQAVSAAASDDVWAVSGARIVHWDGTSWKQVSSPEVGVLRGVVARSSRRRLGGGQRRQRPAGRALGRQGLVRRLLTDGRRGVRLDQWTSMSFCASAASRDALAATSAAARWSPAC